MVRNIDLPESIIFYGMDTIIKKKDIIRPGVIRLMDECSSLDDECIPILLSESMPSNELFDHLLSLNDNNNELMKRIQDKHLILRSSLDEYDLESLYHQSNPNTEEYDDCYNIDIPMEYGNQIGHAPSPAALLDTIHSIYIQPTGFGGSSGFGRQQNLNHDNPKRNPLSKHVVVIVSSRSKGCLDRIDACRLAGMRVVFVEDAANDDHDDEGDDDVIIQKAGDLADAVVSTLGDDYNVDVDYVTIDDVATPGSFWLNPPYSRDRDGDRVDLEGVIRSYKEQRMDGGLDMGEGRRMGEEEEDDDGGGEMGEDEMIQILADLDSL